MGRKKKTLDEMIAEAENRQIGRDKALRYLNHMRGLAFKAETLKLQIERQREIADGLKSIRYGEVKSNGAVYVDAIPDVIAKIDELTAQHADAAILYAEAYEEAAAVIDSIDDSGVSGVVTRRFLLGWSNQKIAHYSHYRIENVIRMEDVGLNEVYRLMPEEWREMPLDKENRYSGYGDYIAESLCAMC